MCTDATACTCGLEPSTGPTGLVVDRCLPSDCCILRRTGEDDRNATCNCMMNPDSLEPDELTSCADLAGATGVVVDQCPPSGEPTTDVTRCAAISEGCTIAELTRQGQQGCCDGSVCKRNARGQAVCTEANDAERALSLKCEHAARDPLSGSRQPKLLTQELQTSVGTLELPTQLLAFSGVSGQGCLGMTEFHLGYGECRLDFRVDVAEHQFVVRSLTGDLAGCPGFEADGSDSLVGQIVTSDPQATFSFDGFSCGTTKLHPNDCVAGTFDLHLDGEFQSTKSGDTEEPPTPSMRISDQHLRFEGVTCTTFSGYSECPAP